MTDVNKAQTARLLTAKVPPEAGGRRVDQILVELFPDYSRSRLQAWIKDGQVTVDGRLLRPRDKLWGGESLTLNAVESVETPGRARPSPCM